MVASKADFIDDRKIVNLLEWAKTTCSKEEVERIIDKAALSDGLTPEETAVLLQVEDPALLEKLYQTAKDIKEQIYGKRLVFFAPLYISDHCINNCVYCGYRRQNEFPRRKLTMEEIQREVEMLEAMGHKRIAMEAGEHPKGMPHRICARRHPSRLFRKGQERRHPAGQHQHRRNDGGRIQDAEGSRDRHLHPLPGDLPPGDLPRGSIPSGPKRDYDWHTTGHGPRHGRRHR